MKKKDYEFLYTWKLIKKKKKTGIFLTLKLTACKRIFQETINKIQAKLHKQDSRLNFQVSLSF